jgi:hypothetical protein
MTNTDTKTTDTKTISVDELRKLRSSLEGLAQAALKRSKQDGVNVDYNTGRLDAYDHAADLVHRLIEAV